MKKDICSCRGMICHNAKVGVKMAFFESRVGGKGIYALLSEECREHRPGQVTVEK